jgi:hypothetical protein
MCSVRRYDSKYRPLKLWPVPEFLKAAFRPCAVHRERPFLYDSRRYNVPKVKKRNMNVIPSFLSFSLLFFVFFGLRIAKGAY